MAEHIINKLKQSDQSDIYKLTDYRLDGGSLDQIPMSTGSSGTGIAWGATPVFYGECSTAAATQTKTVTISAITSLYKGLMVRIMFTNAQTYNGVPKLQINSLTAAEICRPLAAVASTSTSRRLERYGWGAGAILDLTYDGTYWYMSSQGVAGVTYYGYTKLANADYSTSQILAATPYAVHHNNIGKLTGNLAKSSSRATTAPTLLEDECMPTYVTNTDYAVGEVVRSNYRVYRCTTAIPAAGEAWNAAHWEQIKPLYFLAPTQAVIDSDGNISFKNLFGNQLFDVQLPLYDGSVT